MYRIYVRGFDVYHKIYKWDRKPDSYKNFPFYMSFVSLVVNECYIVQLFVFIVGYILFD